MSWHRNSETQLDLGRWRNASALSWLEDHLQTNPEASQAKGSAPKEYGRHTHAANNAHVVAHSWSPRLSERGFVIFSRLEVLLPLTK